jgi:hypothetical protein
MNDEFLIVATGEGRVTREWNRNNLASAQRVADSAINHPSLRFAKAEVFNVFGGHKSDALYTVKGRADARLIHNPRTEEHEREGTERD